MITDGIKSGTLRSNMSDVNISDERWNSIFKVNHEIKDETGTTDNGQGASISEINEAPASVD